MIRPQRNYIILFGLLGAISLYFVSQLQFGFSLEQFFPEGDEDLEYYRDFVDEFAVSLSQFDELLLLDIYPARELPIEGVTSSWLLEKVKNDKKRLVSKQDLLAEIHASNAQVILTIGAGDIGEEVKYIKKEFSIAS